MTWLRKFGALVYIAYLNCESTIKWVCIGTFFVTVGVIAGLLAFAALYVPTILDTNTLSVIYYILILSLWNMVLAIFLLFITIMLTVFTISMVHVSYLYDNKSWVYVNSVQGFAKSAKCSGSGKLENFFKQLDIDKQTHDLQVQEHNAMIASEIQKMKEKFG